MITASLQVKLNAIQGRCRHCSRVNWNVDILEKEEVLEEALGMTITKMDMMREALEEEEMEGVTAITNVTFNGIDTKRE